MASDAPDWLDAERLVALLESTIDPTAVVKHNVSLPIVTFPQQKRQCDVLIESGPASRRQRIIVEVQKRKRKPVVNDVGGWIDKMNEVGANGLICVSHKGFSSGAVERAKREGSRVRLVTVKSPQDPDFVWAALELNSQINCKIHRFRNLQITSIDTPSLAPGTTFGFDSEASILSFNPEFDDPFSFFVFAKNYFAASIAKGELKWDEILAGVKMSVILQNPHGENLMLRSLNHGDLIIRKIEFSFEIYLSETKVPVDYKSHSYSQAEHNPDGWTVVGQFDVEGKANRFHMAITPSDAGYFAKILPTEEIT